MSNRENRILRSRNICKDILVEELNVSAATAKHRNRPNVRWVRTYLLSLLLPAMACVAEAQYAPAVPPSSGVLGYWSTNAGSVLHVHNCGESVCITVVTISRTAPGVIDARNPDPALRDRPVCKMDIGTGFRLKDADHGESGRIYDPETGKTYKSAIASNGNTLNLRGYIGFKAFGRSESWNRTSEQYATCVGTTHR